MKPNETALDVLSRFGCSLKYRSGLPTIDCLLDGAPGAGIPGLMPGNIYEFCGEMAVGKTQLCYSYLAQFLFDFPHLHAAWIDLNGSFRGGRLIEIVGEKQVEFLDRVHLASAQDAGDLRKLLINVKNSLDECDVRLLIIDCVGSMLHETAWNPHKGRDQQRLLIREMHNLCENGLTVFLSNHMVTDDNGTPKPALGLNWRKLVDKRYFIHRDEKSSLIKHNAGEVRFLISTSGINSYSQPPADTVNAESP